VINDARNSVNRFNGFLSTGHSLSDHPVIQAPHVKTFLLTLLAASHLDHARSGADIARQQEHHRKKSFSEEFELFVKKYGLEWRDE